MDKFLGKHKRDEKEIIEKNKKIIIDTPKNINKFDFPEYDKFLSGLSSWESHLTNFTGTNKMKKIYEFVKDQYNKTIIFPPSQLIFNAFLTTPWEDLKVVIIGQDPYPNPKEAMGLSFSVPKGIRVPPSLKNIYKCLQEDKKLNFKTPNHGDLSKWANQGVFLLNATLTVVEKKANSHQKTSGWSEFTDFVIKTIDKEKKGIVFLLWGAFAKEKKKFITLTKNHVIENIHPSPLAANKGNFSNDQFSKTNEILEKEGFTSIDWNLD